MAMTLPRCFFLTLASVFVFLPAWGQELPLPQEPLPQATSGVGGGPAMNPEPIGPPLPPAPPPGDVPLVPVPPAAPPALTPAPQLEFDLDQTHAPLLPPLPDSEHSALFAPRIFVKQFEFTGNTVYSSSTLAGVVASYTNRAVTAEELEVARQALTLFYVNHGYINSGAILPDQDPKDGVIHFKIVEGKLTAISVTGNHWFQTWWLRNEARQAAGEPLNYNRLKQGLQVLRENPTIARVNAELQPGGVPGESRLQMEVKDAQPFRFSMEVNNYRPPSVGSTIVETHASDLNLTGNNDQLNLTYGIATSTAGGFDWSNLDNIAGSYRFPVSPYRTTLEVEADRTDAGIIAHPFNELDIKSNLYEYHVGIRQPLIETPNNVLAVSFSFDYRHNTTMLLGEPFTLSPGAVNGIEAVSVVRQVVEYVNRSVDHVFSARSQFSEGIDAFDSTINAGPPDSHFFSWVGQTQYVRRLGESNALLIARLSGQIADRPLLTVEQLELGGTSSVRGYLENQVLSDNGLIFSLEGRIPLWTGKNQTPLITLAPFTDFGLGWDNVITGGPEAENAANAGRQGVTLPSVGLGLILTPTKYVTGQIYWGYGFNREQEPSGNSLQNQGVEFSLALNLF